MQSTASSPTVTPSCPSNCGVMDMTELVGAALDRDDAAWRELLRRYDGLVRRTVAAFHLPEADAADAVQNTWVRVVEQLGSVREPDRLGGWLKTTARRECVAALRSHTKEMPIDVEATELVAQTPGPEATVMQADVQRAVTAAVDRLNGRRKHVIRMMFFLPLGDYAGISQAMDMPIGSLGPTRHRALSSLRIDLERAGYGKAFPAA